MQNARGRRRAAGPAAAPRLPQPSPRTGPGIRSAKRAAAAAPSAKSRTSPPPAASARRPDRPRGHRPGADRHGPGHQPRHGHGRSRASVRFRCAAPRSRKSPLKRPPRSISAAPPSSTQGDPDGKLKQLLSAQSAGHASPGPRPPAASAPRWQPWSSLALRLPREPHYRRRGRVPPRPGLCGPVRHLCVSRPPAAR